MTKEAAAATGRDAYNTGKTVQQAMAEVPLGMQDTVKRAYNEAGEEAMKRAAEAEDDARRRWDEDGGAQQATP